MHPVMRGNPLTGRVVLSGTVTACWPGMPRHPRIPKVLTRGPFTLADAQAAGVQRGRLRGQAWRRIGPGTYLADHVEDTPRTRLEAASLRLPAGGAFSGLTAAW